MKITLLLLIVLIFLLMFYYNTKLFKNNYENYTNLYP